jgi:hypothetical protein
MVIARHIGTAIRALGPGLASIIEAALLLAGAALIAFGAWQAYPPAGPIVGGALLIAGVILRAKGA